LAKIPKIRVLVILISGYGIPLSGQAFPALQNSVSSRGYLLLPCSLLYPLMTAMKFFQSQTQLPNLLSFAIFLLSLITAIAAEEIGICKPSTWSATQQPTSGAPGRLPLYGGEIKRVSAWPTLERFRLVRSTVDTRRHIR
jgi:hypothetical protein